MVKNLCKAFVFIICVTLLIGCAAKRTPVFKPLDLTKELQDGKYVRKTENLMIILDVSSSMSGSYKKKTKHYAAKDVVSHINQTIPDMELMAGLRIFGTVISPWDEETSIVYGLTNYSRVALAEALKKVEEGLGRTAMILGINGASEDLKETQGGIAIIIVSDWKHVEEYAIRAAEDIKYRFGDRLCIYAIVIGDGDDEVGNQRREEIVKAGLCGYSVSAEKLATGPAMASFLRKVLFKKAPPPVPVIEEIEEEIPVPVVPEKVSFTTTFESDILFDFDSATLKPAANEGLDSVVTTLNDYPDTFIRIEGHTDSKGTDAYNQNLSERRAASVKEALIQKGIDPSRITEAVGFGESMPVSSTDDALNRRVTIETVP